MKIICHREALLSGAGVAASVAPNRSTKPVLSTIKITATKKGTTAQATDLEIAVSSRLEEVIVEEEGEVLLPAQMLMEILRSIESSEVTIHCEERRCAISSDDAKFDLVTDDPTEFPDIVTETHQGVSIPRAFLEEMFSRTAFAAARDIGRYAINGILVEIGEGKIQFVATDGRRLALASRPLPDAPSDAKKAIVPVKGLQECLKGSEGDETVRLLVEQDRIVFSSDRVCVSTKPVEGEFPDYRAVIPQESEGKVRVPRDELFSAVRKVSILAGDEMRSIRVDIAKGTISITSRVEGRGSASTAVEAEPEGKGKMSVDFNPDYLADFLKPLPSQPVVFEYRDNNGAGVFKADDGEDLYVVMPITTT